MADNKKIEYPTDASSSSPKTTQSECTTYEMEFECSNCKTKFVRSIPKGVGAKWQGGECPYCGREDNLWLHPSERFAFKKPENEK